MIEPRDQNRTNLNVRTGTDSGQIPEKGAASSAPTVPLLLEVGCEEIPARFLAQAEKDLGERLRAALEEARLFGQESGISNQESESATSGLRTSDSRIRTYSTPRRLVAHVLGLLERQPDKVEEITGPSVKVAFDKDGKATRAAESFAAKNAAEIDDLYRVTTPKGEYVAVKRTTHGRPALQVLGEILPDVITALSFPKSMYWERSKVRWVRPIRWIVALLDQGESVEVVPFEVADVRSGNLTRGQRTFEARNAKLETGIANCEFRISSFEDYAVQLRQRGVEFDPEKRRERVQEQLQVSLSAFSAQPSAPSRNHQSSIVHRQSSISRVVPDPDLVEWVVNSTEWPQALVGSFEERFLKLPREILITVMRDHQKYFAVEDAGGTLQPNFITFLNVKSDPKGVIRHGHERVLTARFTDTEFFWNADQKIPLRDRLPMLERVTYQAKLGSYGDKIKRMRELAPGVYGPLVARQRMAAAQSEAVVQAVGLCKCDLTTQMVREFPELQGIVGGLYAAAQGEAQEVAEAIYDHYRPLGMEDALPRSLVGAAVSLVDKLDSLAAGFTVGLEPTGSSDPFGLRRLGNGVVRLLAEFELELNLDPLVQSAAWFAAETSYETVKQALLNFLRERLRFYLEVQDGLPANVVRASLDAEWDGLVPKVRARAKGVAPLTASEDFIQVCAAAKRVRNILSQAAQRNLAPASGVNLGLFVDDAERNLFDRFLAVRREVNKYDADADYKSAFEAMATLRQPLDAFFERVMVMDDNPQLRANRLGLVQEMDGLFHILADLSQIESNTSNVDAPT